MADLGRWLSEDYRVPDAGPDEGGNIPDGPSDDDGERESDN
jgi:endogenous inhibitor of DNA gyrase (YacG/DUF329 family)